MNSNLRPYSRDSPHTYAFGRFAAHEALERRAADVLAVLWHSAMPSAERERLLARAEAARVTCRRDDHTLNRLRRKGNIHCVAVVRKRRERLCEALDHVVLVRASHPGNVGVIMRSLVAFGFTSLALVGGSVDPWSDYVIRSSVGLRFALACQEFGDLSEYAALNPRRALYAFTPGGALELGETEFRRPFALLFGPEWSERDWLPGELGGVTPVRIPQTGGVESLNLAVAVSIAAYVAQRGRPASALAPALPAG